MQRKLGQLDARTVIQIAGSDPQQVSRAIGRIRQYTDARRFNLNVGCPSERVSKCELGAVLMRHPHKVAAILQQASIDHPTVEVSVKCRLGVDSDDSFEFFHSFVDFVARNSPIRLFVVHARSAILSGLNTSQNRSIPPLKYDYVYRICQQFPSLQFILNGGINSFAAIEQAFSDCPQLGGVMIGRWPYENNPLAVHELEKSNLIV